MSLSIKKKNCILGRLAVFGTTLIWGTSFVVLKSALNEVPTLYLLALRFTGAAVLMLVFGFKQLKLLNWDYFKSGIIMGAILFLAYVFQTFGLYYTTPGKNAFLTATYCIFVPFLYWLTVKKKPSVYNVTAAIVCIAGVGFVSLENEFTINIGDMLTIGCGVFYAIHMIATDKYARGKSVILLTMLQLATVGVLSWVFALITAPVPESISTENIWSIVYLCVMCTAVCYSLQTFGQKHTPPSSTSIIMALESVFGALISVVLGFETLNVIIVTGFVLIFSAVVISETRLEFLRPRSRRQKTSE